MTFEIGDWVVRLEEFNSGWWRGVGGDQTAHRVTGFDGPIIAPTRIDLGIGEGLEPRRFRHATPEEIAAVPVKIGDLVKAMHGDDTEYLSAFRVERIDTLGNVVYYSGQHRSTSKPRHLTPEEYRESRNIFSIGDWVKEKIGNAPPFRITRITENGEVFNDPNRGGPPQWFRRATPAEIAAVPIKDRDIVSLGSEIAVATSKFSGDWQHATPEEYRKWHMKDFKVGDWVKNVLGGVRRIEPGDGCITNPDTCSCRHATPEEIAAMPMVEGNLIVGKWSGVIRKYSKDTDLRDWRHATPEEYRNYTMKYFEVGDWVMQCGNNRMLPYRITNSSDSFNKERRNWRYATHEEIAKLPIAEGNLVVDSGGSIDKYHKGIDLPVRHATPEEYREYITKQPVAEIPADWNAKPTVESDLEDSTDEDIRLQPEKVEREFGLVHEMIRTHAGLQAKMLDRIAALEATPAPPAQLMWDQITHAGPYIPVPGKPDEDGRMRFYRGGNDGTCQSYILLWPQTLTTKRPRNILLPILLVALLLFCLYGGPL